MTKGPKVESDVLVEAGLALMRQNGKELTKRPSPGRSMLYVLPNGETARVRTSNDRNLIAVANSTEGHARLNIEGTDWLLLIVPEKERTPGNIIAYLLPTDEVVYEITQSHQAWLANNPKTKGNNKTWVLWLDSNGPQTSNDYARKWAHYRLSGDTSTINHSSISPNEHSTANNIRAQIEDARKKIAVVAGVSIDAVKITIEFGLST